MDYWILGLLAAGAVVLYLLLLGIGVLLGIGSVLMQMQGRPDDGEQQERLRASQTRIEAEARNGVLSWPGNRAERRSKRRRA